jgi:hypothetical protein
MDHQVLITGARLRTPRAAAAAGILFSRLLGLALILITVSAAEDPAAAGAWLTDPACRRAVVLLVSVGLTVWVELLFPAWILLLSVDIPRTGLRQSPGAAGTAIGAQA